MPSYIISFGQTVTGINLDAEDCMTIREGGVALNTTVKEHGKLIVCSGGLAKDTKVFSNGEMSVSSGGKAVNTILCDVDFLFARGNSRAIPSEHVNDSSTAPDPVTTFPGIRPRDTECDSITRPSGFHDGENNGTDLSQFRSTSPREIHLLVNKLYPGLSLADQLHLVALIYAINSNGESMASKELVVSLGYEGSPGQFCYCGRIIKSFNKLGYHVCITKNSGRNREETENAGIDGFVYQYPTPVRIYNHLMQEAEEDSFCSLTARDITHLVSFLYTVATNESMPQSEFRCFEHGPSEEQYKYYHRSIKPLNYLGYHIAVAKD